MEDPLPIDQFLRKFLNHAEISAITDTWRIEPERVLQILNSFYREMGLYHVQPFQTKIIFNSMKNHIKNSPEIINMVKKAHEQMEAEQKKTARHA
jgi:hypothetical protein